MATAIIDLDSVCFAIGHPKKVLDEQGNPMKRRSNAGNMVFVYEDKTEEEMYFSADQIMTDMLTSSGATHYIGYLKGKHTTTARLEINPTYKANRKKEPPVWWNNVTAYLVDSWNAKYVDHLEVDDAVNITRLALPDSFITAIDGDLLGLEGTHYNWSKKEWVIVDTNEAFYKFWTDMIAGQTGDNIKGVPGKGEAYAKKLLDDPLMSGYPSRVITAYTNVLGVDEGIHEFYKNYVSLKILEKKEGFVIPEPNEFKVSKLEEETNLFT